jgi:N-acetylmuramoyl-L-alanine amidase
MNFINKFFFQSIFFYILLGCLISGTLKAQEARFTVVLDAGHGGHDPGAIGSFSKEKDINLAVVLDLGSIIEKKYKDVKVIYTRKTDKYLTLQERADVVNNHHADLFICIHTNASPSASAYGAETFTLGLAKSKSNLDVAMRENSVILLEDDYKTKYKGFDPNSIDSYIMFEFMQDKYIDKSVEFSSTIQHSFVKYCQRTDRGVRQAGFWVLHRSACPSVLVELGFISNPAEERYLSSEQGQNEMSTAVFNAFVEYKRSHDKKSGIQISSVSKIEQPIKMRDSIHVIRKQEVLEPVSINPVSVKPVNSAKSVSTNQEVAIPVNSTKSETTKIEKNTDKVIIISNDISQKPVFKVQLFATTKKLKSNASDFKGVRNTDCFTENGINKYTVGSENDFSKIEQIRKDVLAKFPEAFIIAFVGEKKISAKDALKQIRNK